MTDKHQPDSEFVSRLEWRLMSDLRRDHLLASDPSEGPPRPTPWRLARVAALVLFSVLAGVVGVKAAEGWQQAEAYELALARAEVATELSQAKLELAGDFFEQQRKQAEAGVIDPVDLAMSDLHFEQVRTEARMADSRLQELRLSGREPDDRLHAPLVSGRDFVTERLNIELELAQVQRGVGMRFFEQARRRVEVGTASASDLRNGEQQLAWADQQVEDVRHRLELRRQFLEEGLEPRQLEVRSQLEQARMESQKLSGQLEAARAYVAEAQDRHSAGALSELELRQAEFQLLEIEAAARLAELELEFLMRRTSRQ